MYALHNCLMYPLISSAALAGNISQDGLEVANHFGMIDHGNVTSEIKRIVNGCIHEYCSLNSSTGNACNTYHDIPISYNAFFTNR